MTIPRRRMMLTASALLPLAAALPARAQTAGLALLCDLTLGPALRAAAKEFRSAAGVRVYVFPTAPGLIVPLIEREVQIDVIAARNTLLDQAAQASLLGSVAKSGDWSDALVVAEMTGAAGSADAGKFAVSELPFASGIDGAAVEAKLGIDPARIMTAIDTTEVAFLLTSGAARTGLLYQTDVRADPRLRVVRAVADQPAAVFGAAITKGGNPADNQAFITFLGTPKGREVLSTAGLEVSA